MAERSRTTSGIRTAAGINFILGVWLFISPWVYDAYRSDNAWNSWFAGAIVAIVAAIRYSSPAHRGMSWINLLLGIWVFFSPWIFGYTFNHGRFINSLCVGALLFIVVCYGSFVRPRATSSTAG